MLCRETAHALSVRSGRNAGPSSREVLLEQRPATQSVMPGLWELPLLIDPAVPGSELRLTLRHAIMQVNYYVRIRTVFEDDLDAMTLKAGQRRWIPLGEAATMALTGLTRKVLSRLRLLPAAPLDSITPQEEEEIDETDLDSLANELSL
jgi:A/G-specific adenine glycosylase